MNRETIFNSVIAGLGTLFTFAFGGLDIALIVLICFIVLDYLTGLSSAIYTGTVSSAKGYKGLIKKAGIIVVLIMAVLLDRLMGNTTFISRTLVCFFYIANEGISIAENLGKMDIPIPNKLKKVLEQLKDNDDLEVK